MSKRKRTKVNNPVVTTVVILSVDEKLEKFKSYSKNGWTNKPLGTIEDGYVLWSITTGTGDDVITELWKKQ